jgi:hypothetical protein
VISVIVVNPDRLNIAFMIHFTVYFLYYLYYEDISIGIISWHLFPSSVNISFYDSIFVFTTLQGKREYTAINVHKKCTKLTPE